MITNQRFRNMLRIFAYCSWLLMLSYSTVNAQQGWDSTYRPEIYATRVDLYRSFKHSKKDIVFLGNSITFWGEWAEMLNNKHIKNRGIPGDHTFGVLERLDEVIDGKPAKVFILIGINDIARNFPDSVILQNFEKMIFRIRTGSPQTKIYLQTILPTNGFYNKLPAYYGKEVIIKKVNDGLKQMSVTYATGLIDLNSLFSDSTGHLFKELSYDGVHLIKAGYDKWVAELKRGDYLP